MIDFISRKVACYLCDNKNDEYELYKYATYIVLSAILNIITVVILGVIFDLIIESIVFYLSFIAIRKFAGGYHAKTPVNCYIFSVISISVILALMRLMIRINCLNLLIILTIIEVSLFAIILTLSPLDTENNKLSCREKSLYKKTLIIITLLLIILSLLFLFLNSVLFIAMFFGVFLATLVLIIRKIQIKYI